MFHVERLRIMVEPHLKRKMLNTIIFRYTRMTHTTEISRYGCS